MTTLLIAAHINICRQEPVLLIIIIVISHLANDGELRSVHVVTVDAQREHRS